MGMVLLLNLYNMSKEDIKNLWIMVGILIITIALLAVIGCSPQRKLNKLIKKTPGTSKN